MRTRRPCCLPVSAGVPDEVWALHPGKPESTRELVSGVGVIAQHHARVAHPAGQEPDRHASPVRAVPAGADLPDHLGRRADADRVDKAEVRLQGQPYQKLGQPGILRARMRLRHGRSIRPAARRRENDS
jgi:hypothetical protein